MGKLNMDLLKGIEEQENAIENNKAYQEEETFLNLMKQGKSRKEAYEAIGREKTWASKTIKKIRETEPERLKGTGEEAKDESKTFILTTAESPKQEPVEFNIVKTTPQEPQTGEIELERTQPMKNTPEEEKRVYEANTKPQKAVMGFRAEVDKIELWKLYADASEQEISTMCTAALDEYVRNHELTADQKEIFDIKKQALEAEKKIKSRKKKNS